MNVKEERNRTARSEAKRGEAKPLKLVVDETRSSSNGLEFDVLSPAPAESRDPNLERSLRRNAGEPEVVRAQLGIIVLRIIPVPLTDIFRYPAELASLCARIVPDTARSASAYRCRTICADADTPASKSPVISTRARRAETLNPIRGGETGRNRREVTPRGRKTRILNFFSSSTLPFSERGEGHFRLRRQQQ